MKASYYPGCSLQGTSREYDESTRAVCEILGVELEELEDWNCCGASSAHSENDLLSITLPGRNLELAEKAGMDLVVPCSACFQRLKVAEKELTGGSKHGGIPSDYKGEIQIRHLLGYLWEEVGERRKTL